MDWLEKQELVADFTPRMYMAYGCIGMHCCPTLSWDPISFPWIPFNMNPMLLKSTNGGFLIFPSSSYTPFHLLFGIGSLFIADG
jgi:hypothetical protein